MYNARELAAITNTSRHAIRKWIHLGLVPHAVPAPSGPPHYTREHVRRIEAIKELRDNNMTRRDMYDRFHPITEDDE